MSVGRLLTARVKESLIQRMLGGLTLKELVLRVKDEIVEDDCTGRAGELAFFFTLALFPLLIFLISLLGFIPGSSKVILGYLAAVMPRTAMTEIEAWVERLFGNGSGGLLSFSLLFTIWSASTGMAALMDVLNTASDVREGRSFLKGRLVALALTIVLSFLIAGGAVTVSLGGSVLSMIGGRLGMDGPSSVIWKIATYAAGLLMLLVGMGLVYYFGPNLKQRWKCTIPGAVFATFSIILVSRLFSLYLKVAPSYDRTYGSLGAVIVLMLWLYIVSLVILIGGEINAEINQAAGRPTIEREKPAAA